MELYLSTVGVADLNSADAIADTLRDNPVLLSQVLRRWGASGGDFKQLEGAGSAVAVRSQGRADY